MTDQSDIPSWIEVLERPQIDPQLKDEDIVAELRVRLAALFERYDYDLQSGGCPEIILGMARDCLPAFQIKPRKMLPVSGAPIKEDRWLIRAQAIGELRKLEREAERSGLSKRGLARRAAVIVYKKNSRIEMKARQKHRDSPEASTRIRKTISVKTIQHLIALKIPFPTTLEPDPATTRAKVLLWKAEKQLRKETTI